MLQNHLLFTSLSHNISRLTQVLGRNGQKSTEHVSTKLRLKFRGVTTSVLSLLSCEWYLNRIFNLLICIYFTETDLEYVCTQVIYLMLFCLFVGFNPFFCLLTLLDRNDITPISVGLTVHN